jgi:hypothetical protein
MNTFCRINHFLKHDTKDGKVFPTMKGELFPPPENEIYSVHVMTFLGTLLGFRW